MTEKSKKSLVTASSEEWRTYDDWAPGIDGYRLPSTDLTGQSVAIEFTDGPTIKLEFADGATVSWKRSPDLLRIPTMRSRFAVT